MIEAKVLCNSDNIYLNANCIIKMSTWNVGTVDPFPLALTESTEIELLLLSLDPAKLESILKVLVVSSSDPDDSTSGSDASNSLPREDIVGRFLGYTRHEHS